MCGAQVKITGDKFPTRASATHSSTSMAGTKRVPAQSDLFYSGKLRHISGLLESPSTWTQAGSLGHNPGAPLKWRKEQGVSYSTEALSEFVSIVSIAAIELKSANLLLLMRMGESALCSQLHSLRESHDG